MSLPAPCPFPGDGSRIPRIMGHPNDCHRFELWIKTGAVMGLRPTQGDKNRLPSDDHSPWKRYAPVCPLSIPITDPQWKRRPPLVIPRSRLACGKLREHEKCGPPPTRRVPHVRTSVRGPKKTGEAPPTLLVGPGYGCSLGAKSRNLQFYGPFGEMFFCFSAERSEPDWRDLQCKEPSGQSECAFDAYS